MTRRAFLQSVIAVPLAAVASPRDAFAAARCLRPGEFVVFDRRFPERFSIIDTRVFEAQREHNRRYAEYLDSILG